MKEFVDLKTCYMKFISQQLDDPYAKACGKCSNCEGKKFFSEKVSKDSVLEAVKFLQGEFLEIPPERCGQPELLLPQAKNPRIRAK